MCARELYQDALPAEPRAIADVRERLADIARDCGMSDEDTHGVRLGVTEAMTNAIVHAYGKARTGEIRVRALIDDDGLRIVVADDGPGLAPRIGSPGLGLGLPVVAALTQSFELVKPPKGGTEVHMVFPCPALSDT